MKRIQTILLAIGVFVIVVFAIDIFNLPSDIFNANWMNVNFDLWKVLAPMITTISLFALTYHLIDKRHIEQLENKKKYAMILINKYSSKVEKMIEYLENPITKDWLLKKYDGQVTVDEDLICQKTLKITRDIYNELKPFMADGIVEAEIADSLIDLNNSYEFYAVFSMTLFDHREAYAPYLQDVKYQLQNLTVMLKNERS